MSARTRELFALVPGMPTIVFVLLAAVASRWSCTAYSSEALGGSAMNVTSVCQRLL